MTTRALIIRIIILMILFLLSLMLWLFLAPAYREYKQQHSAALQEKIEYYERERRIYDDFLSSTQLPSGAYASHPYGEGDTSARLNPYFACYNAIGLMEGLGRDAADTVRQYLDWHMAHLNRQDFNGLWGTIYDYSMFVGADGNMREINSGSYDSADSYAALFLWTLADYVELTGDSAYALSHTDEILLVVQVLFATQSDGLSFAMPNYPVFFLMDNSEVYHGLLRANALINAVYADASSEQRVRLLECRLEISSLLDTMYVRIEEAFWDGIDGHYRTNLQKDKSGSLHIGSYDPNLLYPDAVSQLFPIAMLDTMPDANRADLIYQTFCDNFSWQTLSYIKDGSTDFYWGIAAYCAALQGDEARLNTYLAHVKLDMPARPQALFNADAAWIARACAHMQHIYQEALDNISFFSFIGSYLLPNLFSR